MGNRGSRTAKVAITGVMHVISKWTKPQLDAMFMRATNELSDYFALNMVEFEILLGRDTVGYLDARSLFETIFQMPERGIADKFEVMCVACLASQLNSAEKIGFMFDIFNFNSKGFLVRSEITFLFVAALKGSSRVDKTIKPPTEEVIEALIEHAFTNFAKRDPKSLRKPEFVKFAIETLDVRAFLDAWRGHSGQVLLSEKELWKDWTFQACALSVTPSKEWVTLGMPPAEFIRWRRKELLFPLSKEKPPFNCQEVIMKTQDRRVQYWGTGIVANGTIRRGLLADKWFLTAVAALTAKPPLLFALFANTGQEESGRYAVRFFEGLCWRTVYIDDRIPCTYDGLPMFSKSSDSHESGLMLLEKAMAKYLGSYGHIGLCGTRVDSPFMALRMLTGGHILRYQVSDFEWRSVNADVKTQDGTSTVMSIFKEGSIVCFGVSELRLLHRWTLERPVSRRPPHGFVFPMAGSDIIDGYQYVILKDPWGVATNYISETEPEPITGHCRTFRVRVEDIASQFDTIIISRFPDLARIAKPTRIKLDPWHSEFLTQPTRGPSNPAVFMLRVYDKDYSADDIKIKPKYNLKKLLKELDDDNIGLGRKQGNPKPSVKGETTDQGVLAEIQSMLDKLKKEVVDVAFTVSSNCEWIYSGAPAAFAQSRVVMIPSKQTRNRLRMREILRMKSEKKLADLIQKIKKANEATVEYAESEVAPPPVAGDNSNPQGSVSSSSSVQTPGQSLNSSKYHIEDDSFQHIIHSQSSCVSKSVRLVPGVYFIFADISFDIPYEEMLKKTLSALHPQERPWLEFRNENEHDLHIHVSSHSRFLLGCCSNVGGVPRNTVDLNRLPNIPAKHHFICESQSDAASRGLVNMVTDMGQLLQIQEAKMVQMQTAMESVAKQMEENYKL